MNSKKSKNPTNKSNEIENSYKCHKCRDLTFIIKGSDAYPCECRAIRQCEDILNKSGIGVEFRKKRFDNFEFDKSIATVKGYKNATGYVGSFLENENTRNNSIMFLGQVGSGKTHLSIAIANELMDSGISVIYMGYRDVITRVKQNMMDSEYYHKVMNRYKNARVLLIDDLFKGKVTDSDINIMFELVNHRYFNNLPVIVSSECVVEKLLDIDEALGSRLIEMSRANVVEMKGRELNYRIYG